MSVSRGTGVSLWLQIAEVLKQEIRREVFAPGSRLPTEAELAGRFGVNRHTLRRAVAALEQEGLLRVEQGRGTFVREGVIDYPVARRTRFSENMRRFDGRPSRELLRAEIAAADREAAAGLGRRGGAPLVVIEVLNRVDGRPVSLSAHHFCARRFPTMIEAYRALGSFTKALEQLGVEDYTRKETRVTARPATQEEADLLQMPRGRPLLVTESINLDPAVVRLEYGRARFAGERVQIVFET